MVEELAQAGIALDKLRAAARTNWSGVELCAEVAVAAGALNEALPRWRAASALEPTARAPVVPETRQTYGTDIGSAAPLYLGGLPATPRLEGEQLEAALESLRRDGAAVVAGVAEQAEVQRLRRKLRILGGGPCGCPSEVATAELLAAMPGAAPPLEPTSGRRHFLLRGTGLAEAELVPLLAPLMPLVYRYFAEQRPDAPPGSLMAAGAASPAAAAGPRLFLSECQLLVSDPGAVPQMWHRDNRRPGLTVLLPWTDVDHEVGPTQLLPGSHHLVARGSWSGRARAAAAALRDSAGAAAAAPLTPGDALVYDARVLHRGLGNSSYGRCRVVLVLRIDYGDSPPPGASVLQTQAGRVAGRALQGLGALYAALPVPTSPREGSSGAEQ